MGEGGEGGEELLQQMLEVVGGTPSLHEDLQVEVMKVTMTTPLDITMTTL